MRTLSSTSESRHPDPVDGPRGQAADHTRSLRSRHHLRGSIARWIAGAQVLLLTRPLGGEHHSVAGDGAVLLSFRGRLPRHPDAGRVHGHRFHHLRWTARSWQKHSAKVILGLFRREKSFAPDCWVHMSLAKFQNFSLNSIAYRYMYLLVNFLFCLFFLFFFMFICYQLWWIKIHITFFVCSCFFRRKGHLLGEEVYPSLMFFHTVFMDQ